MFNTLTLTNGYFLRKIYYFNNFFEFFGRVETFFLSSKLGYRKSVTVNFNFLSWLETQLFII